MIFTTFTWYIQYLYTHIWPLLPRTIDTGASMNVPGFASLLTFQFVLLHQA